MRYQLNPLMEGQVGNMINASTKVANNAGVFERVSKALKNRALRRDAAKRLKDLRKGMKGDFGKGLVKSAKKSLNKGDFDKAEFYSKAAKNFSLNSNKRARDTAREWVKNPEMFKVRGVEL